MANFAFITMVVACGLIAAAALGVLATLLLPQQWRTRRQKRDD